MSSFEINDVDAFTTGTVGPSGERIFYLQAHAGSEIVSLKLEKQQVQAVADYLVELLADAPEIQAQDWTTAPELVEPVEPLWIIGAMGAVYDPDTDSVLVMAEEFREEEDEDAVVARATFRLGRGQTVAFIERAIEVIGAGRPPCTFCGRPLNYGEDGFCSCWN